MKSSKYKMAGFEAVIARLIVSRSLISPTNIMSGSSLKADLNALLNEFVSSPTSLCLQTSLVFKQTQLGPQW